MSTPRMLATGMAFPPWRSDASDVSRYRPQAAIASVMAPQMTRTTPVMRPIQPPQGTVFSISTMSAIAAIQARLMMPPTNSSAISIQQQEGKRRAAMPETGLLERGPLIDAGNDQHGGGEHPVGEGHRVG